MKGWQPQADGVVYNQWYCDYLGVVIEIDGTSHDFKVKYDMKREAYLQGFNLLIIHILDIDIKQNLTGVLAYLHQQLKDKMMQMKWLPRPLRVHPFACEGELSVHKFGMRLI